MGETLLVEIFTEELPPKALSQLAVALAMKIHEGLDSAGLTSQGFDYFATPRRLAFSSSEVLAKGADKPARVKVLPVGIAMDANGEPTQALARKLASLGFPQTTLSDLERAPDGKSESFFLTYTAPGKTLAEVLQTALAAAIATLPIPKVMRYQSETGEDVAFVRPAHGLVALHGADVVPVNVLGLTAGRVTHGHRFQGASDITLAHADEYEEKLDEGGVIASFVARCTEVKHQLLERAKEIGADARLDQRAELLDEVTALVEMPTVYVGEFELEFLQVPQECLILTMQANQKYFPLFDTRGKLLNQFLIVSNMRLDDPRNIIEGNQRVIRPRLADARFFYDQDRKLRLADRVPQLAHIVYHNRLGSLLDRVGRLQRLAVAVAAHIGADAAAADRAALLAKADLVTNMVGEFPELQGTMGCHYARHDREDEAVAEAIEAHYRPRFARGQLPMSGVSTAVALADKLELLAGMFGIGQQPTGDKDPFGLRRAALGMIRILVERQIAVGIDRLLADAYATFDDVSAVTDGSTAVADFIYERLRGYIRELGYSALEAESVIANRPTRLDTLPDQLAAVRAFMAMPEAPSLTAANKRVANILRKSANGAEAFAGAQPAHLAEPAERALFDALADVRPRAEKLYAQRDYTGYLKSFASLKSPVDSFFDSVMVMVDDPVLRANRLALLTDLRDAMNRIADLSKLAA